MRHARNPDVKRELRVKKTSHQKSTRVDTAIIMIIVALSLGVFLYPTAANWVNTRLHAESITGWTEAANELNPSEIIDILEAAERYNERLAEGLEGNLDDSDESYLSQLVIPGSTVMARVVVPSINVVLPVFHGTSSQVLDVGAGHMYGTSLPVGGLNTNSVITAHSGIDGNRLFNDLHDMEFGDVFMVEVAGRIMFYQVDQITIVEYDTVMLFPSESGNDYLTLLTCTPIGINSHRLLVRGVRFEPEPDIQEVIVNYAPEGEGFPWWAIQWLSAVLMSGIITNFTVKFISRRKAISSR